MYTARIGMSVGINCERNVMVCFKPGEQITDRFFFSVIDAQYKCSETTFIFG